MADTKEAQDDKNQKARTPRPSASDKKNAKGKKSAATAAQPARKKKRKTKKPAAKTRKTRGKSKKTAKPTKKMEKNIMKNTQQFEKMTQSATEMSREGIEAFIKTGTLFAKGMEDIIRTSVTMAQETAEKQAQYMKDAMSSKTLNEWTDVQNKIAQESFDDFMTGATKISELSVRMLTEAAEPLNDQLSKGIKKASESVAA